MASQFIVDNQGVGMYPTLTLKVDTTANKDFSQADLDAKVDGTTRITSGSHCDQMGLPCVRSSY